MTKNKETKPAVTRAAKKDGVKKIVREILEKTDLKAGELIDEAAKAYAQAFDGADTENPNDVKGRIGSVIDVMKKDGEITSDGGVYALNKTETEEKPKKTTRKRAKKEDAPEAEEKPKKRTTKKAQKTEEKQPLPPAPLQPIAPTAPVTPETAPEPIPQDKPKKRVKKAKVEEKTPEQKEEKVEEQTSPKGTLMDMSFLLAAAKPPKKEEKPLTETVAEQKPTEKKEEKPVAPETENKKDEKKAEQLKTPAQKQTENKKNANNARVKNNRPLTADERLQEAFLTRLRRLGGEYFEYYSVYLLERYSRINGRRLEALKITAGDHDGGIDGEIELTDRLGFRETIYIQAKNWDPDKGDEKLWTVGETLLQQFIGACVCRQAKDGKQHCRGIFITTSRFTADAKRILDDTADKFVGYDGTDLFEAAKECQFGLIYKNGQWSLDEKLLSGMKAFFTV